MVYCPRCKEHFLGDLTSCPRCNYDLENGDVEQHHDWVVVGRIEDRTSADYAKETLRSYDIPCVIFAEAGYLGNVGLSMPTFTGKPIPKHRVHVPAEYREEAVGILDMILGDGWEKVKEEE